MSVRITCITKTNHSSPHERIQSIGGTNADGTRWKRSQQQAILDIEAGTYSYYVQVGLVKVDVIVALHQGNKYIKTRNDGVHPDNLLSLPECA
jgi:hypothetical protein